MVVWQQRRTHLYVSSLFLSFMWYYLSLILHLIFFSKDPSNFIKEENQRPWCSQNLQPLSAPPSPLFFQHQNSTSLLSKPRSSRVQSSHGLFPSLMGLPHRPLCITLIQMATRANSRPSSPNSLASLSSTM